MSIPFYRAFEDRHRGSRELIKGRQRVYLPFIEPLKQLYEECPVLDLGCGRGEWLEILLESGFKPKGVDLDPGMLEACQALGLPAEQADALVTLKGLPDESQAVVSGFHIAEHIPFTDLQELVVQAFRVLKPGGLLILETPNAENLVVGTQNFYLDPTHERPIPHLLLSFLTEYSGFARSKLLRLQESPELRERGQVELMDVLGRASPDYAIVAQKLAPDEQAVLFDYAFEGEYGLSLDVLAKRYGDDLHNKFMEVFEKLDSTSQKEQALTGQLEQLQSQVERVAHSHASSAGLELRTAQLETIADQLRLQLQEAGLRIQHAESRVQQAELSLRDSLTRVAQAEARQSAVEAINESLRPQVQQVTSELLALYKSSQRLEILLEQAEAQIANMKAELAQMREHSQLLEAERDAFKSEIASAQAQIAYLETHLTHQNSQIEALTAQLTTVEEQKSQLAQDLQQQQELQAKIDQVEGELQDALQQLEDALSDAQHGRQKTAELEALQLQTQQQLNESLGNAHHWYLQAEQRTQQLQAIQQQLNESLANAHNWYLQAGVQEDRVKALLCSASWRITWPLRVIMVCMRWVFMLPVRAIRSALRGALKLLMRGVLARPALRDHLSVRMKRCPKLHSHLRQFAHYRGLMPDETPASITPTPVTDIASMAAEEQQFSSVEEQAAMHGAQQHIESTSSELTFRARQIYQELKQAIQDKSAK